MTGSQMFCPPNVDIVFQKCTLDPSDPNPPLDQKCYDIQYSNTTHSNQNLSQTKLDLPIFC